MSRKEREALRAWLDADPALRAAWNGFIASLGRVTGRMAEDPEPDMSELREAIERVEAAAGIDRPTH